MDERLSQKEVINYVLDELVNRNLLKKNISTYKNTESLLYKYPSLKKSIEDREEEIEYIKKYGFDKIRNSTSIVKMSTNLTNQKDYDIDEEMIRSITRDVHKIKLVINRIDRVLKKFKDDKYIDIIRLKYFEGKTQEEIAEYFEKDYSTLWRNNKRLINEIKIYFFPNDVIEEIKS